MERTYPPRELLGALTAENLQIAFAGNRLRLLVDAFRVWPQGLQFEVRTIETLDLYPDDFDIQSLDGRLTGHGLEILAFSRTTANRERAPYKQTPAQVRHQPAAHIDGGTSPSGHPQTSQQRKP